jgi:hypothetical protein
MVLQAQSQWYCRRSLNDIAGAVSVMLQGQSRGQALRHMPYAAHARRRPASLIFIHGEKARFVREPSRGEGFVRRMGFRARTSNSTSGESSSDRAHRSFVCVRACACVRACVRACACACACVRACMRACLCVIGDFNILYIILYYAMSFSRSILLCTMVI